MTTIKEQLQSRKHSIEGTPFRTPAESVDKLQQALRGIAGKKRSIADHVTSDHQGI